MRSFGLTKCNFYIEKEIAIRHKDIVPATLEMAEGRVPESLQRFNLTTEEEEEIRSYLNRVILKEGLCLDGPFNTPLTGVDPDDLFD